MIQKGPPNYYLGGPLLYGFPSAAFLGVQCHAQAQSCGHNKKQYKTFFHGFLPPFFFLLPSRGIHFSKGFIFLKI